MFDKKLFQSNPRDYALDLVENSLQDAKTMLINCLNFMSHDDVREMLDANELSPRFDEDDEDDEENDQDNE